MPPDLPMFGRSSRICKRVFSGSTLLTEPNPDEELLALIRLSMVAGVGPRTSRALLTHFESASGVLAASRSALQSVEGVGPKLADKIVKARDEVDAGAELALCRSHDVRVLSGKDPEYPGTLQNIPDPPGLLYIKGRLELRDQLAIAVVGSGHCTTYGVRIAERLAGSLARTGFTVVSGLGGIDAAAHRGVLNAGGRTIAVLANGLASVYPPEHEDLARAVVEAVHCSAKCPCARARSPVFSLAQSHYLWPVARSGGCRGRATERIVIDGQSCDGTEPRGLRGPGTGR